MKTLVKVGKLEDKIQIPDDTMALDKMNNKAGYGMCCKVTSVLLTVLLVAATITLGVLYIVQLKQDTTKHVEMTVHYENGDQQTEFVVITDDEEEFETNDVHLIFDYTTGLTVLSYKSNPDLQDCYVNSFNMTTTPSPEVFRKQYKENKVDVYVNDQESIEETYIITDIWLNPEVLGPRSQHICQGKDVYFLRQIERQEDTRVKRQSKPKDKPKEKETTTTVSIGWGLIKITVKNKKKN